MRDWGHILTGCCRNPFSLGLKRLLINLGLAPGDVKTRPLGFKQLTSLIFRFAKIYYQKRFNDRSNGFPFGQQPVELGIVQRWLIFSLAISSGASPAFAPITSSPKNRGQAPIY